jgi:hypothetical protein
MTGSRLNLTLAARTVFIDGSASGLRNIDSLGSILRVIAGPFSELDRMKAGISSAYIAYVIDTPLIYIGYGRVLRSIGDRIEEQVQPASQVFIIYADDPRFAKFEASYIEDRLIKIAAELGVPLANRVRPFGRDGIARSPDLEQLVAHAQILLSVAGFRRFEEARQAQSDLPMRAVATGNLNDVNMLDPETMTVPTGAVLMRLAYRSLQAGGWAVGKRFHVLAGADYCYTTRSGLSEDNRQRRSAIEALNILQPMPGIPGRARLLVGLDCKSAAIAGKILSGEHIGTNAWQTLPDLGIGVPS